MSLVRWAAIALLGTAALAAAVFVADIRSASSRVGDASTVVSSPHGNIEFKHGGSGPPVLVVHGSGGGYDQGELIAQAVLGNRFHWIAPSRFGYLRSTFQAHATFDDQARAYANLILSDREGVEVRYTTDGTTPTAGSPVAENPVRLTARTTVMARAFRGSQPVSPLGLRVFRKIAPWPAAAVAGVQPGLKYTYYEGLWDKLPDFSELQAEAAGVSLEVDLKAKKVAEGYGFEFSGFLRVPRDGVYTLFTSSDDGSRLWIDDSLIVDNDGLHARAEASGLVALAAGLHAVRIAYFNATGDEGLTVSWKELGRPIGWRPPPGRIW